MKVAYNACYGGFGLSMKASTEYAKRKGINLTWYKQVEHKHQKGFDKYVKVTSDDGRSLFLSASTKDLGDDISGIPEDCYYYKSFDDNDRIDSDLINIIEEMGDDANGSCAELRIQEIPDGASYEIDEYDGNESVVPPRQAW